MKKEYHYSQEEREELHNPCSDWVQGKRGEQCVNAATLRVDDIAERHGVKIEPPKLKKGKVVVPEYHGLSYRQLTRAREAFARANTDLGTASGPDYIPL